MAGEFIVSAAHDALLSYIKDKITAANVDLHVCSQSPANYTDATTQYNGGANAYSLGNDVDITSTPALADGGGGRQLTIDATAGTLTFTGGSPNATHWALVDTSGTALLAVGPITGGTGVTSGNNFTLTSFTITSAVTVT